jgi:putative flavoprotein involved in K+ transport
VTVHHFATIVGGGAAGLAVAAMLQKRGVRPLVLERAASLGQTWLRQYDRLKLHTARSMSGLPGCPIPNTCGQWVSKTDFANYLAYYSAEFDVQPRLGVAVQSIARAGSSWILQTSAGPITSDNVIISTGANASPYTPPWPGLEGYRGHLIHSCRFRNALPYRGRSVLVIGCGNSGAEILAELAESGVQRLRVAIRTPPNIMAKQLAGIPTQYLGVAFKSLPTSVMDGFTRLFQKLTIGDLRRYGLPWPAAGVFSDCRERQSIPVMDTGFVKHIRSGRIECVAAVQSFSEREVILCDGARVTADTVIAATGYRPDLGELVGGLGVLDFEGRLLVRDAESPAALPGLYFIGFTVDVSGVLRRIASDAVKIAETISAGTPVAAPSPERALQ